MTNAAEIREYDVEEIVEPEPVFGDTTGLDRGEEISSAWRAHDSSVRKAVGKETPESREFDRTRVHVGRPIELELAREALGVDSCVRV